MSSQLADYIALGLGFGCILVILWIVGVFVSFVRSIKTFKGVYQGDLFDE